MRIIHSLYPDNLVAEAIQVLFHAVQTIGEKQQTVTIGLSGGTSLLLFYRALIELFSAMEIVLRKKIRFAFLDERLVSLTHPDSNYRLLSEVLFAPLLEKDLLTIEQILVVRTDIDDSAIEYSFQVPNIDIGLFGVGPDGHIASLFPNHIGLQDTSDGYILVHDSPKPPSNRISVSIPYLKKIPSVFLFFIGEGKRDAYENFLDVNVSKAECPAKYLLGCEENVVVTDLKK